MEWPNKSIWFDMDGTIADLYKVDNWLACLRSENPEPYILAQPMVNTADLATILYQLKNQGWTIGVISWLSKEASKQYDNAVRKAKRNWLKRHIPFVFDHIHLVKYGTPKHRTPFLKQGILIDDNNEVRDDWHKYGGYTIDASQNNWIETLRLLVNF